MHHIGLFWLNTELSTSFKVAKANTRMVSKNKRKESSLGSDYLVQDFASSISVTIKCLLMLLWGKKTLS